MAPLALTPGEPAGIGVDLAVLWAQQERDVDLLAVGDPDLLLRRARLRGIPLILRNDPEQPTRVAGELTVLEVPVRVAVEPGRLNPDNAEYVLQTLDLAIDGCLAGRLAGLVTGPVQKSVINEAGIGFSGHTEYLAARCGVPRVVMMLVAGELRVALATTHVALRDVAALITEQLIAEVLEVLRRGLSERFALPSPRILVAGLNPHAGESGHLGREELDAISPALVSARARGCDVLGPLPADTIFTPAYLAESDAILAMYHDQGLPALKAVGFGEAVNVTLGLPMVRTSVDHGTALDLAGSGTLNEGSLAAAIALAARLASP